jgi:Rrf2 family protein
MGLMQISRKVDYALRAVIYLSTQDPEKSCSAAEIAAREGMPPKFVAKIIQDLIRGKLVRSKRGWGGGYSLARLPHEISFRDVIEAVDGPIAVNVCMDEELSCDRFPRCTMFGVWSEVQRKIVDVFTHTTLADLRLAPCQLSLNSSSLSSAA